MKNIKFKLVSQIQKKVGGRTKEDEYLSYQNIKLTQSDIDWVKFVADRLKVKSELKEKYIELLTFYKKNERLKEKLGYKTCKKCGVLFKGEGPLCPVCKLKD